MLSLRTGSWAPRNCQNALPWYYDISCKQCLCLQCAFCLAFLHLRLHQLQIQSQTQITELGRDQGPIKGLGKTQLSMAIAVQAKHHAQQPAATTHDKH
jgi:hypothetical protein